MNIIIPLKSNKKLSNKKPKTNLEGQIELKRNCIKYFHGCWVKCIKKSNGEYNSGGFLTKLTYDIVYLRNIQSSTLLEFSINDYKFYVKQDSEHYIAMQQIELEKERIKFENVKIKDKIKKNNQTEKYFNEKYNSFNDEKLKFEEIREKFFKLFRDGKVKITV